MSLFRKPKKQIQRRVFTADEDENIENSDSGNDSRGASDVATATATSTANSNATTAAASLGPSNHHKSTSATTHHKKERRKEAPKPMSGSSKISLLSFETEEEGEIFQVKKSSHSKKVMRMLDKERRKSKKSNKSSSSSSSSSTTVTIPSSSSVASSAAGHAPASANQSDHYATAHRVPPIKNDSHESDAFNKNKKDMSENSNSIQTEIRTDDFVLVVKKSEPEANAILNGRAALCAGRDDMSSEDDDHRDGNDKRGGGHRFNAPDNFKMVLESGAIPDAAMIHAARKRRQKAREQGDFIAIEQLENEKKKGNRLVREDGEDDGSEDEERVDMSAITGIKEQEERREKFYSVQQDSYGEESDYESNEWENQQIRKGVTGAQLVSAHQESVFSQYMIQPTNSSIDLEPLSTAALLEQAYAITAAAGEKQKHSVSASSSKETKPTGPKMPHEIVKNFTERLIKLNESNTKHRDSVKCIDTEMVQLKMEALEMEQMAPVAAAKYKFYQELRGYVGDLIECLDEKVPLISDLEKKLTQVTSKHANNLIERRRQDVRDQAKEVSDAARPGQPKKCPDDEEHVRRAAEREGRRTRRRRHREKIALNTQHLDGMSSDDEIADHDANQYAVQLQVIAKEAEELLNDASDEYSQIHEILIKFECWKKNDLDPYRDAYVSLCIPKLLGPLLRLKLLTWNPLNENYLDLEKMDWYTTCLRYSWSSNETESMLANDPDARLIPAIVEKVVIPKLNELIENCWDPLSTTQTLRLVGLIRRFGREYPSLRPKSKPLIALVQTVIDKMKNSLNHDVFIPIFPKQMQEAKSSFFQRQFCSGLKLFRNLLSWQGILSDKCLKEMAISSLLNRYLLSAMRVCTVNDAIAKAHIVVNTLPRIWLQDETELTQNMEMFIQFLKHLSTQLVNPQNTGSLEKLTKIYSSLHITP